LDILEQVVSQVTGPSERLGRSDSGDERHFRNDDTQPTVQQVVTSTRDGEVDILFLVPRQVGGRTGGLELSDTLGEPSGLDDLADEISNGIIATIHTNLMLVISSQINE